MRMGVPISERIVSSKQSKPLLSKTEAEHEAAAISVGFSISGNLIDTIYSPYIKKVSGSQSEKYAEDLLAYEDAIKVLSNVTTVDDEVLLSDSDSPPIERIASYLFGSQEAREGISTLLSETSDHFTTSKKTSIAQWKVHVNAAKFERQLDEKYGFLRPFITKFPGIEIFIRNSQRKFSRGEFSPIRADEGPIDKKTSIIILFIMYRNGVKMENMILAILFFIVGLKPWALVLVTTLWHKMNEQRKNRKIRSWVVDEVKPVDAYYKNAKNEKEKHELLRIPVGNPVPSDKFCGLDSAGDEFYDTLVVGSGPSTLYTAALLSRTGRKIIVLSPQKDASGCFCIDNSELEDKLLEKYRYIPFDIDSNNVAHISRQQQLLAPALCTKTDAQGGIRFHRIGSKADGFTSDILSIPGMGVDHYCHNNPYLLRTGGSFNIAIDAAFYLGDGWPDNDGIGNSSSAAYLSTCSAINASASDFYTSKLLHESINEGKNGSSYQDASIRHASVFLNKAIPLNVHVRSLMAGVGIKGENLPPTKTSMATHVTNICAQASVEGFTYPVGGPRALCHALESVIKQNGGEVLTEVEIKEFIFSENDNVKFKMKTNNEVDVVAPNKPRCHGVSLVDGRTISIGTNQNNAVVSMIGFLPTLVFNMPDKIRSKYGICEGLSTLAERRPLLQFLIGIQGSAEELNLTGADWYRLPNAGIALDELDSTTSEDQHEFIGVVDADVDERGLGEPNNDQMREFEGKDNRGFGKRFMNSYNKHSNSVEFDAGVSWMKVSFPSAKDPSWKDLYGNITTCVVNIEAGDEFVQLFESSPTIFLNKNFDSARKSRLLDKVKKDLLDNFPQLENRIEVCKMIGPIRKGLSQTPQKYAAKGIRPETSYPGLFIGGPDLTVGDSFSGSMVSGWMVANAVLKYSSFDHLHLNKNITYDLARFLSAPQNSGKQDIAVPYQTRS